LAEREISPFRPRISPWSGAAVAAVAAQLLLGSPQGLAESKRLTTARVREAIDREGDRMVELSARLFASEEAHEGMVAFLERRPPRWAR